MVENLKTTRYNDGTVIPLVTDDPIWSNLITPGYCWYNNDAVFKEPYGALYNWYVVNTGKLSPQGWHVPSDNEWANLINYLGGEHLAGGKLKEAFISIGGVRYNTGPFAQINNYGCWWSSSEVENHKAWSRYLCRCRNDGHINKVSYRKQLGFSVRCVKD